MAQPHAARSCWASCSSPRASCARAARALDAQLRAAATRLGGGAASARRWCERFEAALEALSLAGGARGREPRAAGAAALARAAGGVRRTRGQSSAPRDAPQAIELLRALALRLPAAAHDEDAPVTLSPHLVDPVIALRRHLGGVRERGRPAAAHRPRSVPAAARAARRRRAAGERGGAHGRGARAARSLARRKPPSWCSRCRRARRISSCCRRPLAGPMAGPRRPLPRSAVAAAAPARVPGSPSPSRICAGEPWNPLSPLPGTRALTLQNACPVSRLRGAAPRGERAGGRRAGRADGPARAAPARRAAAAVGAAARLARSSPRWTRARSATAHRRVRGAGRAGAHERVAQDSAAAPAHGAEPQLDFFAHAAGGAGARVPPRRALIAAPVRARAHARALHGARHRGSAGARPRRRAGAHAARSHRPHRRRARRSSTTRAAVRAAPTGTASARRIRSCSPTWPPWARTWSRSPPCNVTAREVRFCGVAGAAALLPRVPVPPRRSRRCRRGLARSSAKRGARWSRACIAPSSPARRAVDPAPGACDYCHLSALCRIGAHTRSGPRAGGRRPMSEALRCGR